MLGADPAQVKKKKFLSESRSGLGRLTKKAHYMFRKINLFFFNGINLICRNIVGAEIRLRPGSEYLNKNLDPQHW